MTRLTCVVGLGLGLALLFGAPLAEARTANFRRPEVLKLTGMNPWADVAKVKAMPGGNVVAACETAFTNGTIRASFNWIFVPHDRTRPVRPMGDKEVRGLGLRTVGEAQKEAVKLGQRAKFAAGKPFSAVWLRDITTHHTKHKGTGLSYVFGATPAKPLDMGLHPHDPQVRLFAHQIGLSVPMVRAQRDGQSAWPIDQQHVPVSP